MTTRETCYHELLRIRDNLREREIRLDCCEPYTLSALNMQDYISLKKHELVPLQQKLSSLGLSSLGMAHFHIMHTIEKEIEWLSSALEKPYKSSGAEHISFENAYELLKRRAEFLKPNDTPMAVPSVMITLPSDAAEDPLFIETLHHSTIDICRINTAHDTPCTWQKMADMVHRLNAGPRRERPMRIYVDLAGPKFRTGALRKVSTTFKIRPFRTPKLRIVPVSSGLQTSARVTGEEKGETEVTLVVDKRFYKGLRNASTVRFHDGEGRKKRCRLLSWSSTECLVESK
ncbi:MAG: hypothetical protein R3302_09620, partial [Sulfurimonadaceae bacterium]|nr:hypothetical protein [Sulfurimonadaceae bacterium]